MGILAVIVVLNVLLAVTLSYSAACEDVPVVSGNSETMTAVVYRCYGSSSVLRLEQVDIPQPADNEMLVRIRAASVNPLDWHYMRGSPYIMRLSSGIGKPNDVRVGVDFSGVVVAAGSDVTRFEIGDEVFGGRNGAFSEYVTVRENGAVVHKPVNVSFEEAAAAPIAAITALQALRDHARVKPGDRILINGASGGVGTFAVQIAKSMGAEVTGVCSTRNVEMVRSLGADFVVDYKSENYTNGNQPYDAIIDNVGNHSLSANLDVLTDDGSLVLVGGAKGDWIGPMIGPIKAAFLSPFVDQNVGMMLSEFRQADLESLASLMASGAVTAVIDRRYTLEEIAEAIDYSESGRARGKIVITVSSDE